MARGAAKPIAGGLSAPASWTATGGAVHPSPQPALRTTWERQLTPRPAEEHIEPLAPACVSPPTQVHSCGQLERWELRPAKGYLDATDPASSSRVRASERDSTDGNSAEGIDNVEVHAIRKNMGAVLD